jgi:hypothetical protein
MKYGAAVAVAVVAIALALPVYGQRGAAHGAPAGRGGFSSSSGFAEHAGFAERSGLSGPSGIARPSAPIRYGGFGGPGFSRMPGPMNSGLRVPFRGGRVTPARPPYRPASGNHSYGWNHNGYGYGHGYQGSYVYAYLGWPYSYGHPYAYYPYPFVIDPGFYDWSLPGDNGDGEGGTASYPPYADYGAYAASPQEPYYSPGPYPQQQYEPAPMPSGARPAYPGATSGAPAAEESLTLIFKNGRAPQTVRNYMMNSKTLTNMDQRHYEQIPLDQIDIAATQQANRARGLDFQVPVASRE